MPNRSAAASPRNLMDCLPCYHGKNVIVLSYEYDTPFKGTPCLERGLMTGITCVAKESIFPDMNNLKVIMTTTEPTDIKVCL